MPGTVDVDMPVPQGYWTDETIDQMVNERFVRSKLISEANKHLNQVVFEDLSDDTYLDWILTRCRRVFLTLLDAESPHQIFRLVEEGYEDSSLPIPEKEIPLLQLPAKPGDDTNKVFYKSQFKYLVRTIREGSHIMYSHIEQIPVHTIDHQKGPSGSVGILERVRFPPPSGTYFIRKTVPVPNFSAERDILSEIAQLNSLRHDHLIYVFGSYSQDRRMHLLMQPAARWTLKTMLGDPPKIFSGMSKQERRMQLLVWPHCLANAVAWLHTHGMPHGAICPSGILVDDEFNVILGPMRTDSSSTSPISNQDSDLYIYAAPETCQGTFAIQSPATSSMSLEPLFEDLSLTESISTKARSVIKSPTLSSKSRSRHGSRTGSSLRTLRSGSMSTISDASSIISGSTSSSDRTLSVGSEYRESLFSEAKTLVMQDWRSAASDPLAADMFSLAAVMLDVLTVFCGQTINSFMKNRAPQSKSSTKGMAPPDTSFHANLNATTTWAARLIHEADRKGKKAQSPMFSTVRPMMQSLVQCLDYMPDRRLRADLLSMDIEQSLGDYIGIKHTHCTLRAPETPAKEVLVSPIKYEDTHYTPFRPDEA